MEDGLKNAIEESINFDPIQTRSLKFKNNCENALKCYEELYTDMARWAKQKSVLDSFRKIE